MQGGPMTPGEARDFEQLPFFQQAVDVRRWDDQAKVAGLATPPVAHFLTYLPQALLANHPVEAAS